MIYWFVLRKTKHFKNVKILSYYHTRVHNNCLGKDVFEDENISALLKKLFVNYCSKVNLEELEFFNPIPGITSFYDLLVYSF